MEPHITNAVFLFLNVHDEMLSIPHTCTTNNRWHYSHSTRICGDCCRLISNITLHFAPEGRLNKHETKCLRIIMYIKACIHKNSNDWTNKTTTPDWYHDIMLMNDGQTIHIYTYICTHHIHHHCYHQSVGWLAIEHARLSISRSICLFILLTLTLLILVFIIYLYYLLHRANLIKI